MKSAGIGAGLIAAVVVLIWLGTGFFIVQEGQQAVITQFGRYKATVGAGFNWRLPYPIQRHELVFVTQIRSVDVGRDNVIKSTGLRESAMLTEDENIVEIKFAVQYRLSDARAYLFESKNPSEAVVQAAETAVRETVGKMRMDSALAEERDQIAPRVRDADADHPGPLQGGHRSGGHQPAARRRASARAGAGRFRRRAQGRPGTRTRQERGAGLCQRRDSPGGRRGLAADSEEADAYKAKVVAQAQGDAQRFKSVLAEYQRAPQVTRDRMYIDAMQQIYSNVTKILVESRQGSSLLYLPLDKIMQQVAQGGAAEPAAGGSRAAGARGCRPASRTTRAPATARAAASANRAREADK